MRTPKYKQHSFAQQRSAGRTPDLLNFFGAYVVQLEREGRSGSAANYRMACRKFASFLGSRRLSVAQLTREIVVEYETWLRQAGLSPNTISFYLRYLRAVYNAASMQIGLQTRRDPFLFVRINQVATIKRAISPANLRRIVEYDLSKRNPRMALARDLFLFSFFARGMSFVDMAYLRKSDIHDNTLSYRRRKTGQWLTMAIEPCMQEIIDRYNSPTDYLLPILQDESYKNYRSQQRDLNRHISALGLELEFERPLTFYVARHTWATMARDSGAPIQVISAGMGHTSERTTNIYLAQLDHNRIDDLNRQVISQLSSKPKRSKR